MTYALLDLFELLGFLSVLPLKLDDLLLIRVFLLACIFRILGDTGKLDLDLTGFILEELFALLWILEALRGLLFHQKEVFFSSQCSLFLLKLHTLNLELQGLAGEFFQLVLNRNHSLC